MRAHLETLTQVVRVFDDDKEFGEEYTWCATIRYLDHESIEIVAAMRAPTPSEWRALREAFIAARLKRVLFYRVKDGTWVKKEFR